MNVHYFQEKAGCERKEIRSEVKGVKMAKKEVCFPKNRDLSIYYGHWEIGERLKIGREGGSTRAPDSVEEPNGQTDH